MGGDKLAMASTSLMCNPHVQSNITLRNNLRSRMGDRPRMIRGGKTINKMGREFFN